MIGTLLLAASLALAAEASPEPTTAPSTSTASATQTPESPSDKALRAALATPRLQASPQEVHLALRRLMTSPTHQGWARQRLLELARREPTHASWHDTYRLLLDEVSDAAVHAEIDARVEASAIRRSETRTAAIQALREALAQRPDDKVQRRILAEAMLREGNPAGALAVLLQGPTDPAAAELRYLATLGSRALSGPPLERLARAAGQPDPPGDGVGAARVLEQLGYFAAAETALQTHSGTPSTSPTELKVYCRLLLDRGASERAAVLLDALLRVSPDDSEARALRERARQGWAADRLDLPGLRKALRRDPGDADLLISWAERSLQAGHDPLDGLLFGVGFADPADLDRVATVISRARRARGDALLDHAPDQAGLEFLRARLTGQESNPAVRVDRTLRLALGHSRQAALGLAHARWRIR